MISFDTSEGRFNYRSAAVIQHEEHVLIHRAEDDDFWALPGGRVEFMERSEKAVTREIMEELGVRSYVVRHLWHVENFFHYNTHKYHELSNYYLVGLEGTIEFQTETDFSGIEDADNLIFRWVPLLKIGEYTIMPSFLGTRLNDLPLQTEYLHVDEVSA